MPQGENTNEINDSFTHRSLRNELWNLQGLSERQKYLPWMQGGRLEQSHHHSQVQDQKLRSAATRESEILLRVQQFSLRKGKAHGQEISNPIQHEHHRESRKHPKARYSAVCGKRKHQMGLS